MKNAVFAIFMFFVVLVTFSVVHAENNTEYERALKFYHNGKYREAVSLFSDYVQKRPEASAYYYLGYASYKLGKHGDATEYFQQAFLIDPDFSLSAVDFAENPFRKKTPQAP